MQFNSKAEIELSLWSLSQVKESAFRSLKFPHFLEGHFFLPQESRIISLALKRRQRQQQRY